MNPPNTTPLNVVHEAIDERQHVRTRLPATATLSVRGQQKQCEIIDISLGGMALSAKGLATDSTDSAEPLSAATTTSATITLNLQHFEVSVAATVKVVSVESNVVRVTFVEIEQRKVDTLRYIIASYISGDVVNIDGVFNVMQRENYIKERKVKPDTTRSHFERFKALAGSLIYLAIGLTIFSVIAYKLFIYFFQVQAISGVVNGSPYTVSMPENGYVKFLIDEPQGDARFVQVQSGQLIATVSSQLMTSFNTPDDVLALTEISQQDLQTLYGKAFIETVITSPCDCNVFFTDSAMDRYAYKEQPLMHMLRRDRPLMVKASFPYEKISDLGDVKSVQLSVFGGTGESTGTIVESGINPETGLLDVVIEPDQSIGFDHYLKPVAVEVLTATSPVNWAKSLFEQE